MSSKDSALSMVILEQMADAVIYANSSGRIELWNGAATALFGYSASEALGQSLDLIIPEYLRDRHWVAFKAAMASGVLRSKGRPTLTRGTHKDGGRLYLEMSFGLVKQSGITLGAVGAARDATDREKKRALSDPVDPRSQPEGSTPI